MAQYPYNFRCTNNMNSNLRQNSEIMTQFTPGMIVLIAHNNRSEAVQN